MTDENANTADLTMDEKLDRILASLAEDTPARPKPRALKRSPAKKAKKGGAAK